MNNKFILLAATSTLLFSACKKEKIDNTPADFGELKTRVIYNFADDVASRTYGDINNAALKLSVSVQTFEIGFYDGIFEINHQNAKANWKILRNVWEQASAFQYGPVLDGKYNEKLDTWPVLASDIENLLSGSASLEQSDIEKLPNNLKGMHALEYMLFGTTGGRDARYYSGRDLKYMVSLAKEIQKNCQSIYSAYVDGSNSFSSNLVYTTKGGKTYATKQSLFTAMVVGLQNTCSGIVANGLGKPYDSVDSTIVESPFSNTSLVDIRNNMNSVMNVYTGRYNGSKGYGLKDILLDKNSGLDGKIVERMTAVDSALAAIKMPLDSAIYFKRPELKKAIDAVDSLRSTFELELTKFVTDNITD